MKIDDHYCDLIACLEGDIENLEAKAGKVIWLKICYDSIGIILTIV